MEKKTDNELIAEFMGHPSFEKDGKRYWRIISDKWDHLATESRHLRYESQWNDLMPVVEKIELLNKRNIIIDGKRATTSLNIELIHDSLGGYITKTSITKIESIYHVCVEFIKWYNASQPPRV